MRLKRLCLVSVLALATACMAADAPMPLVSPIFGDNMVLQRGKPIRFWGWAEAGEKIHVELAGHSAEAVAKPDGRWQAELPAPEVGKSYAVQISGAHRSVALHNVLVGDVWLCGGQSNMELPLSRTRNGADEIAAANRPEIRLFKVQDRVAYAPTALLKGEWKVCSPEAVAADGGFSAVAYFYGRKLQETLHVPIGLIEDCWGGTPVESWMNPESLHKLKDFDVLLAEIDRLHKKGGPEYGSFLMHWLDEYDIGNNRWSAADFDDSSWKPVQIPGGFAEFGVADGPAICWFRREVTLPNPLPRGAAVLHLGVVEKTDHGLPRRPLGWCEFVGGKSARLHDQGGCAEARHEHDRCARFQAQAG